MNVGDLKKMLKDVDDRVEIVRPGSDHSYIRSDARMDVAGQIDHNYLGEWAGLEYAQEGEIPIVVVVVE
jgi:hypothetical protein